VEGDSDAAAGCAGGGVRCGGGHWGRAGLGDAAGGLSGPGGGVVPFGAYGFAPLGIAQSGEIGVVYQVPQRQLALLLMFSFRRPLQ
jgi:hypothetical protein